MTTITLELYMNYTLLLCLSPLVIVFLLMKFVVWIQQLIRNNHMFERTFRKRGPYVENAYADLDEEDEEYGDRTDFR